MGDFEFSFNIGDDCDDGESTVKGEDSPEVMVTEQNAALLRPAKELLINEHPPREQEDAFMCVHCEDLDLCYIHQQEVEGMIADKGDVKAAISTHSDLLPCVYEGGLKIWECSLDLVQYIQELDPEYFSSKAVLELGCGAGLPGIYALKKGATVHFQDYNEEVLRLITIPNAQLNTKSEVYNEKCRFFAGDWRHVQDVLMKEGIRYDVILTAETIYSLDSQPRLYNIIRGLLKPNGKVYVAAKTHYFGVGGGTRQFEDFVQQKGEFEIKVVKVISKGVQREILEMCFIQSENKAEKT